MEKIKEKEMVGLATIPLFCWGTIGLAAISSLFLWLLLFFFFVMFPFSLSVVKYKRAETGRPTVEFVLNFVRPMFWIQRLELKFMRCVWGSSLSHSYIRCGDFAWCISREILDLSPQNDCRYERFWHLARKTNTRGLNTPAWAHSYWSN